MQIHLVDGTYELFRHFFALPSATDAKGREIAAVRGVLASILSMLEDDVTHIGVATDHVVESFRNDLFVGYKTSDGIPPDLHTQFPILEEALEEMGVLVWPMVEFEADDALASAAHRAQQDPRVTKVFICTPDKDLSQSVVGKRVVQFDRRQGIIRDEAGVVAKFGVAPASIPDLLAVVGDSADGYPGVRGWGLKTAASIFSQFPHLEDIPKDSSQWPLTIRRAKALAESLFANWENALLYRTLATLRTDVQVFESIDQLRWQQPHSSFEAYCQTLNAPEIANRVRKAIRQNSE